LYSKPQNSHKAKKFATTKIFIRQKKFAAHKKVNEQASIKNFAWPLKTKIQTAWEPSEIFL
jgi:hypothetical protein